MVLHTLVVRQHALNSRCSYWLGPWLHWSRLLFWNYFETVTLYRNYIYVHVYEHSLVSFAKYMTCSEITISDTLKSIPLCHYWFYFIHTFLSVSFIFSIYILEFGDISIIVLSIYYRLLLETQSSFHSIQWRSVLLYCSVFYSIVIWSIVIPRT